MEECASDNNSRCRIRYKEYGLCSTIITWSKTQILSMALQLITNLISFYLLKYPPPPKWLACSKRVLRQKSTNARQKNKGQVRMLKTEITGLSLWYTKRGIFQPIIRIVSQRVNRINRLESGKHRRDKWSKGTIKKIHTAFIYIPSAPSMLENESSIFHAKRVHG